MALLLLVALASFVLACMAPGPSSTGQRASDVPGGTAQRTLTVAIQGEPNNLPIPTMGAVAVGSTGGGDLKLAVHQHLATYDDRGEIRPQLADIPSQAAGTWILRPDGSMQTTYRLRPDIRWHDGTPLQPRDFVFAWTVTTDAEIPLSSRLGGQISRIDTPDERTLVFEWRSTYPFANAVVEDEIAPLPAHLLETTYRADKERFQQLGYWTKDFVGVGPYQVAEWEPGSHLVLKAFDRFYGGSPGIQTIVVRFMSEESAVVAGLLSGAVDGSVARALEFGQAMFVKREWERAGKRPVVVSQTTHWRLLEVQLRPELARPRDILDTRVRRGLLLAIDRQALVDAVLEGQAPASDTFIPPDDSLWDQVKDVVVSYPYDARQAQSVLTSAGWQRAADGVWSTGAGENPTLSLHTRPGQQGEQEIAIIADYWKALGIPVDQVVLSAGEARDNRTIATFPGFAPTSNPLTFENTLQVMYGPLCPSDRSRWSGRNHGCYQSAEMDRAIDGLRTTIEPLEQHRFWREMAKLHTEELPLLPLYFNVQVVLFREGVTGVRGDTKPRTSSMWNVAEWRLTA
jgi:peptide/nickel transport system substrate-binding protein